MDITFKKHVGKNCCMQRYNFYLADLQEMKELLIKFYYEFLHAFNFPCTWSNKISFCQ